MMAEKKLAKKIRAIFAENIDSAQIIKHVHNKRVQALWMQKHVFKTFACMLLIEFVYWACFILLGYCYICLIFIV